MDNSPLINFSIWYDLDFLERIQLLLDKKIFYVYEKDWDDFIEYIHFKDELKIKRHEADNIIKEVRHLKWNNDLARQIQETIKKYLVKLKPGGYYVEIWDSYQDLSKADMGIQFQKTIITDYLQKLQLEFKKFCDFTVPFWEIDSNSINKEIMEFLLETSFDNDFYDYGEYCSDKKNLEIETREHFILYALDEFAYCGIFLEINEFILIRDYLKNKYLRLEQEEIKRLGDQLSNPNNIIYKKKPLPTDF